MFATILVVWYGASPLSPRRAGKHPFHFDNFASLLLTISFGFAMVNYYSTPIPGVGTSFHNLITGRKPSSFRADRPAQLQNVVTQLGNFRPGMDSARPWGDFLGPPFYVRRHILARRPHSAVILVVNRLWIHRQPAVCVLVGRSSFRFLSSRKWSGCSGLVSLLPAVRVLPSHRAAVVYVIGISWSALWRLPPPGTLLPSSSSRGFRFSSSPSRRIYALLKVPALTNHIFSGTAGVLPRFLLEAPASAAVRCGKEL